MFSVYIRRVEEKGKIIFPNRFCLTEKEMEAQEKQGKDVKSLEALKSQKGPYEYGCTPYDAPILMSDFTFKPIGEVKSGDTVIGWKVIKNKRRQLVITNVLKTQTRQAQVNELYLESKKIVRCTTDHNWYTGRLDKTHREYKPAKIGSKLQFITNISISCPKELKLIAAWLGGIFDGEGSCSNGSIYIYQSLEHNPEVYHQISFALTKLNFAFKANSTSFYIKGGRSEEIRFINWCNPIRKFKIIKKLLNKSKRFITYEDKVNYIQPGSIETVFALVTETGNYISQGYASKNCQYLNDPVDDASIEFRREWFRKFEFDEETEQLLKTAPCIMSVDPAFKLKETHDDTGIVVAKPTDRGVFILEAIRIKVNADDLVEKIFELVNIYEPYKVKIETVAAQILLDGILRKEMTKRNISFMIDEYHPGTTQSKAVRIRKLIPPYANGQVLHRKGLVDLEEQLIQFPRGRRDDIIDALAAQVDDWNPKKVYKTNKIKEGTFAWWKQTIKPPNRSIEDIFNDFGRR